MAIHYDVVPVAAREPELGLLAGCFNDGTREWRDELGEVSDELVVWQPFPKAPSIGTLILHMIDVEAWWIEEVAAGRERPPGEAESLLSDAIRQDDIEWPDCPSKPYSWFLSEQDRIRSRTLQTLAELEGAGTARWIQGYTERSYTARWIAHHVLTHESYHGGQAVLLKTLWERR